MNFDPAILKQAYKTAKKINAKYGTSYFFASRLFQADIRNHVHTLYAFFRIPDEIVDSHKHQSTEQAKQELLLWQQKWEQAYHSYDQKEPILYATSFIFHHYKIPYQYSLDFFAAMTQDIWKTEYATYDELVAYMYGSAAVVGLILSHVIGFEKGALPYAEKLGYAMQLTNFLRDIDEDYKLRKRIYLPQTELKQFAVSKESIEQAQFSVEFKALMQFQITRARRLYDEAQMGITMLNPRGRKAVLLASKLYAAILQKIEQKDCNIFLGRARTTLWEKLHLLLAVLVF